MVFEKWGRKWSVWMSFWMSLMRLKSKRSMRSVKSKMISKRRRTIELWLIWRVFRSMSKSFETFEKWAFSLILLRFWINLLLLNFFCFRMVDFWFRIFYLFNWDVLRRIFYFLWNLVLCNGFWFYFLVVVSVWFTRIDNNFDKFILWGFVECGEILFWDERDMISIWVHVGNWIVLWDIFEGVFDEGVEFLDGNLLVEEMNFFVTTDFQVHWFNYKLEDQILFKSIFYAIWFYHENRVCWSFILALVIV